MPPEPASDVDEKIARIQDEERHADRSDAAREAAQTDAIIEAMEHRKQD